jgi:hypothetical protein
MKAPATSYDPEFANSKAIYDAFRDICRKQPEETPARDVLVASLGVIWHLMRCAPSRGAAQALYAEAIDKLGAMNPNELH